MKHWVFYKADPKSQHNGFIHDPNITHKAISYNGLTSSVKGGSFIQWTPPECKLRWAKATVKLVHYLDGDHH